MRVLNPTQSRNQRRECRTKNHPNERNMMIQWLLWCFKTCNYGEIVTRMMSFGNFTFTNAVGRMMGDNVLVFYAELNGLYISHLL